MKTTTLILIAAFLSFTAMSFSTEDLTTGPYTIKISLEKAVEIPGFVTAIHQQLDPKILFEPNQPRVFTAEIKFNHKVYMVSGPILLWRAVFIARLSAEPEA